MQALEQQTRRRLTEDELLEGWIQSNQGKPPPKEMHSKCAHANPNEAEQKNHQLISAKMVASRILTMLRKKISPEQIAEHLHLPLELINTIAGRGNKERAYNLVLHYSRKNNLDGEDRIPHFETLNIKPEDFTFFSSLKVTYKGHITFYVDTKYDKRLLQILIANHARFTNFSELIGALYDSEDRTRVRNIGNLQNSLSRLRVMLQHHGLNVYNVRYNGYRLGLY